MHRKEHFKLLLIDWFAITAALNKRKETQQEDLEQFHINQNEVF